MRVHRLWIVGAWLLASVLFSSWPAAAGDVPQGGDVSGTVLDQTGSAVPGARVLLLTTYDSELRSALTSGDGRFHFAQLEPSVYVLAVEKAGFLSHRRSVVLAEGQAVSLEITLGIGPVSESVTVTPARGNAQEVLTTPQFVTVTPRSEFWRRNFTIFPQALAEEPGVHVQQTSTSQGSPFVRGLTGQQVVALIDGVRYNNSTFRPGANQYTALIETAFVDRVEIVRGPNAAQYGSDSLGGTINILTRPERGAGERFGLHGDFNLALASGDSSAAGSAYLSGGGPRWGFLVAGGGHRAEDLRTGGGIDSHSVATRLLGLPSSVLGDKLEETSYSQYGVRGKVAVRPGSNDVLTLSYLRGQQIGASRYDQLNGGLGNLINRFDPQTLDFAVARYDRIGVPLFDSFSATLSYNGQQDDRTYQSINNATTGLRSPISEEHNYTKVFGYQAQAGRRLGRSHAFVAGAELYDEDVSSTRQDKAYSSATGDYTTVTNVRARFPNGTTYRTGAVFAQDVFPFLSDRLTVTLAGRYSWFHYRQSAAENPVGPAGPLVPDYATTFSDPTFNTGLAFALTRGITLTGSISRGFRAPNVNDFGAIGISGGGFEVSPDEAMRLDASVAPFSTGAAPDPSQVWPAAPLKPEELYNYEVGAKLQFSRVSGTVAWFDAEIQNLIERRVVILAPGAVGTVIGGQTIIRQDAYGQVYTALSNSPVFVRTNAGRVRMQGTEGSLTARLTATLSLSANASYVRGEDLTTGLPPGLENGIPPLHGYFGIRWQPRSARYWAEAYSHFAGDQTRFSGNDLGQARIGGTRTKQEITNFFNNGAVARGLVQNGILVATGETLSQVLSRVLGPDLSAKPLYTMNPGYATFNLRGGVRLSKRSTLIVIGENLFDANYRLMGSGVDGVGRSLAIRFGVTF